MTRDELNALDLDEARAALEKCCGASAWVEAMCAARPFSDRTQIFETADEALRRLRPRDWLEAFAHHPRIGDVKALRKRFQATADWEADEQQGAANASDETLELLAEANRAYEQKFGYIFIVCAAGRTADQMLALLKERLGNDPEVEMPVAAEEQMEITRLRLKKLLGESPAGESPTRDKS